MAGEGGEASRAVGGRDGGVAERGRFLAESGADVPADPYREDDEALNALLELTPEGGSVLDVGGGAGRFAVALAARRGAAVTVVDPSRSMLEQLEASMAEVEGANVRGMSAEWELAQVESADMVLCSHVVYGVPDIRPFLQKLHDHARRRVIVVSFVDSPQAGVAPLWEPVYGEARVNLPALPELMNVLWEMGYIRVCEC